MKRSESHLKIKELQEELLNEKEDSKFVQAHNSQLAEELLEERSKAENFILFVAEKERKQQEELLKENGKSMELEEELLKEKGKSMELEKELMKEKEKSMELEEELMKEKEKKKRRGYYIQCNGCIGIILEDGTVIESESLHDETK